MSDLTIAYLQTALHWEDAENNHQHFERLFNQLKSQPDLVVMPETFNTGFPVDAVRYAQPLEGASMQWMAAQSARLNAVVCGSLLIKQNNSYQNTFVWMRPNGSYALYAKRHVFRMGGEHELIAPGNSLLTVELKGWRIRPMICYDLRFPVWSRNTYENNSWAYDLLIYVANWPAVRSYPWQQLLIARAIENQSYVLGVNRIGTDGTGNAYSGHSCLIDAKGEYISQAIAEKESVIENVISLDELLIFRRKFNVGLDWDAFNMLHLPPF